MRQHLGCESRVSTGSGVGDDATAKIAVGGEERILAEGRLIGSLSRHNVMRFRATLLQEADAGNPFPEPPLKPWNKGVMAAEEKRCSTLYSLLTNPSIALVVVV